MNDATLRMGQGFPDFPTRKDDPDVLSCVGIEAWNQFLPESVLDDRGFIKINR